MAHEIDSLCVENVRALLQHAKNVGVHFLKVQEAALLTEEDRRAIIQFYLEVLARLQGI